jgi:hypothetical protein
MTKKLVLLTGAALAIAIFAGCHSSCRTGGSWFNRGGRCNVCPPPDCPPGLPQAQMMLPATPQVMPGPIEIAPTL